MTKKSIDKAKLEANRFLQALRLVEAGYPVDLPFCSKETGALKRASLDLTRALAEMRKTG